MRRLILSFATTIILITISGTCFAQSVSIKNISPGSPANLNFNQTVSVSFEYSFNQKARISVYPITSGNLSPNSSMGTAKIYSGTGTGVANFTIREGNITVDQLKVQVLNASQNDLLFEFYIPVNFTFTSQNVVPNLSRLDSTTINQLSDDRNLNLQMLLNRPSKNTEKVKKIARDIADPENNANIDSTATLLFLATPSADPPEKIDTTNIQVDKDWIKDMHKWIDYQNDQLRFVIELLLGEELFRTYKNTIQKYDRTLYEKVDHQSKFLIQVLQDES